MQSEGDAITTPKIYTVGEYQTLSLPEPDLPYWVGEQLWRTLDQQGKKLHVSFPSPKTAGQWQITAQGWVGQIQIPHQLKLLIKPKLPIARLLQLWETAFEIRLADLGEGLTSVSAIADFFNLLAQLLAQQVIRRSRLGFQRAYVPHTAVLPYIRGKWLTEPTASFGLTVQHTCRFEAHTADVPDNQIVAYTLYQIAQSGQCTPPVQKAIRRAYHLLQPLITLRPFQAIDCQNRSYSRLNQDYAVLHALCRFFLEHTAPEMVQGQHQLMPLLLNMGRLYERCVANWLQTNLPAPFYMKAQEYTTLGLHDELRFQIDLTLYGANGRPLAVLDTKYKTPDKPSQADISQVITYAKATGCHHAFLIYPQPLRQPLHVAVGDVQLNTLCFNLAQPLNQAGQQFVQQLWAQLHL